MKHSTQIGFSFLLIFFLLISTADAATFLRNLSQGKSGNDVRELQKVLNSNPVTRISLTGPGSPGQETTYFGRLTTLAVIKFQKLYGISPALGFVGPHTREKLNSAQNLDDSTSNNSDTATFGPISSSSIKILSDLATNQTSRGASSVRISSFTPSIASLSDHVTVTGSGFSSENNLIYTPFGEIKGLSSSNGSTLEFNMSDILLYKTLQASKADLSKLHSFNLPVAVSNASGISNTMQLPLSF